MAAAAAAAARADADGGGAAAAARSPAGKPGNMAESGGGGGTTGEEGEAEEVFGVRSSAAVEVIGGGGEAAGEAVSDLGDRGGGGGIDRGSGSGRGRAFGTTFGLGHLGSGLPALGGETGESLSSTASPAALLPLFRVSISFLAGERSSGIPADGGRSIRKGLTRLKGLCVSDSCLAIESRLASEVGSEVGRDTGSIAAAAAAKEAAEEEAVIFCEPLEEVTEEGRELSLVSSPPLSLFSPSGISGEPEPLVLSPLPLPPNMPEGRLTGRPGKSPDPGSLRAPGPPGPKAPGGGIPGGKGRGGKSLISAALICSWLSSVGSPV